MISLQPENSIAPVTCQGHTYSNASKPFLTPPFHGWTTIVSYVDHDLPDYSDDGYVITANGDDARISTGGRAADFPAYWNPSLRQYIYYDGHNGYDYDLYYQPVYAAAPGKVIFAAMEYPTMPASGYGNMVMIEHRHGYVTLYGHFSRILVRKGEHVKRGQQIGVSGNTGHSSGPHLHFTVFHNCSPTDPYGWTGSGPDPLSSYKGETSIWLWKRQPLISNPLPNYPGISLLPAPPLVRIALVTLPASGGPSAFSGALRSEAAAVAAKLPPGTVHFDARFGAVEISARIPPVRLLSLPFVDSIAGPDALPAARHDMLNALARAALHAPATDLALVPGAWSASIYHLQGRTYLLGEGQRGRSVDVSIPLGTHRQVARRITATDVGGYAIDLGSLTGDQVARLRAALEPHRHHHAIVHTVRTGPDNRIPSNPAAPNPLAVAGLMILVVLSVATLAGWQIYRTRG